jgi:hypothetical protein
VRLLREAHKVSIGHLGLKRKQNPENIFVVSACR